MFAMRRKQASVRKRCAECRAYYTPLARLAKAQRVCGEECRRSRRRKLAGERRARSPAAYRRQEKERKRRSRERQRAQAVAATAAEAVAGERSDAPGAHRERDAAPCHAPGETLKHLESLMEFDRLSVCSKARRESHSGRDGHAPGGFSIP